MLLEINAKARWDGLVWYSEPTKMAWDLFVLPLPSSQFTISKRYVTPKTFSTFEIISTSFALLNPSQAKNITPVWFSELELNKKASKTNLYWYLLYFVSCWITLLEFNEMVIGFKKFWVSICNPKIRIVSITSNILCFSRIVLFFFERNKLKFKTVSLAKCRIFLRVLTPAQN